MDDHAFDVWLYNTSKAYRDIKEQFHRLQKYPDEELQAALIQLLMGMEKKIEEFQLEDSKFYMQKCVISSVLKYEIGKHNQESATAEQYLKDALAIVEKHPSDFDCLFMKSCIVNAQYALGGAANVNYPEQGIEMCEVIAGHEHIIGIEDLFLSKKIRQLKCNLSRAAQIRAAVINHENDYTTAIVECWEQIEIDVLREDKEPMEWSERLIKFADCMILCKNFRIARRVLSCATLLITRHENALKPKTEDVSEEDKSKRAAFQRIKADVCYFWGIYGVSVLSYSVKTREEPGSVYPGTNILGMPDAFDKIGSLVEAEVKKLEVRVICTFVTEYGQAKTLFDFCKNMLYVPTEFYKPNERTDDHIKAIRAVAELHKYMSHYERIFSEKIESCLQCVTLLEEKFAKPYVKDLFPVLYLDIMFDIGCCYWRMMVINCEVAEHPRGPTYKELKEKITSSAKKTIELHMRFVNYFKIDGKNELPIRFLPNIVEAYANLTEAYLRPLTDSNDLLEKINKVRDYYGGLLLYFKEFPEQVLKVKTKLAKVKRYFANALEIIKNPNNTWKSLALLQLK